MPTKPRKVSKSKAGGLRRPPLLLFRLGIVLVVDLQGLLLYNVRRYSKLGATVRIVNPLLELQIVKRRRCVS